MCFSNDWIGFTSAGLNGRGFVGTVGSAYSFKKLANSFSVAPTLTTATPNGWGTVGNSFNRPALQQEIGGATFIPVAYFKGGTIGKNFIGFRFMILMMICIMVGLSWTLAGAQ